MRLNRAAAVLEAKTPQLLDVGCSVGVTLEAADRRGWNAVGVDVSGAAVRYCNERGLKAIKVENERLPFDDESFDVLTAWHVIEHVADVRRTLAEWRRVLRVGGLMVLETPDASCFKVRMKGASYRKFWAPEHTYTFEPNTLGPFVEQAGFEQISRPWVGRLSDLSPRMAAYAVAYQAYHGLRCAIGVEKAFQIFARRTKSAIPSAEITAAVA